MSLVCLHGVVVELLLVATFVDGFSVGLVFNVPQHIANEHGSP